MEGGPPSFPRDFPCPAVLGYQHHSRQSSSPTGLSPSSVGLPSPFGSRSAAKRTTGRSSHTGPTTPRPQRLPPLHGLGLGSSPVRSPLLGASRLLPLPRGTEMFHFPRFPSPAYGFSWRYPGMTRGGLPHSDIRGSQPVDGSPRLFAVSHVLHRPLAPRHPPRALLRSALPHRKSQASLFVLQDHYSSLLKVRPPGTKNPRAIARGYCVPSNPAAIPQMGFRDVAYDRLTITGHRSLGFEIIPDPAYRKPIDPVGGPFWTRTRDLGLIRTAL